MAGKSKRMLNSSFYSSLEGIFEAPDKFLDRPENLSSILSNSTKSLYALLKNNESDPHSKSSALKQLLTDGFDSEQIWQQIQLQNSPTLQNLTKTIKKLDIHSVSLSHNFSSEEKQKRQKRIIGPDEPVDDDSFLQDEDSSGDESISEEQFDEISMQKNSKKFKATPVDDKFFMLREMEEFLDDQDRKEQMRKDGDLKDDDEGDEIDLFNNDFEEDDEDNLIDAGDIKFKDFFDPPKSKKSSRKNNGEIMEEDSDKENGESDSENDSDVENDENDENIMNDSDTGIFENENSEEDAEITNESIELQKSKFEMGQDEMQLKINSLEESNLSEKPWQLKGETTSKQRPVNSLLEEHVTFDHTSVGAPVVTEETTETLEDLIKQRIKDQAWDDVIRKQKPSTQPYEYKKAPELNMEKSKQSLAEVYEKEYLKQAEDDKEEKENESHVLINKLMDKLFVQLDALSNFQFTPKPPKPELKIITNAPSLQMEEVTPITMTDSSQLAPEEIYDKKKGDIKGDGEKTSEDKNRERRQKKLKKKFAVKEKERKENLKVKAGKVSKSSKKTAIDMLKKGTRNTIVTEKNSMTKAVKGSSDFFSRLQDEAKTNISKQKNHE